MLTIVKRSVAALIATVTFPLYSHQPAAPPSEPSTVNRYAIAGAPRDAARQADVTQAAGVAANGQRTLSDARPVDRAAVAPTSLVELQLAIGDKIKIGIYETIEMGGGGQSSGNRTEPEAALRTFYQRMDLSGDYTVEQDGSISIPLLGRFQVEGRALDDIRADLAASFMTVFGRNANVDARITDRSPVYVVGPVKNPGAYKYAPGMIVLQAIALAGGLDRGADDLSGAVEGAREMERVRIAALQIEQLLARRARLQAERDGISASSASDGALSSVSMPDESAKTSSTALQLVESDRGSNAENLVATESTILRAKQARRREEEKGTALRILAARNEVDALKHKLAQFDIQRDLRNERLEAMEKLKDRGVETSSNVLVLRTELADVESRRQDTLAAVIEAEARLSEVEGDSRKLSLDYTAELAKEMAGIDKDIGEARETMVSAKTLATILYRPINLSVQAPTYEIVRQSNGAPNNIPATETSPLTPGDVLKVDYGNTASIDASPSASAPQSRR